MKFFKKCFPAFLILFVVLLFFFPVFKGQIPFPGDLLVNINPYNSNGYLGYQPGGYPNKAQGPDVIYEIYPWRYFSLNQLKQFSIPFWNPYNFSGNPQMANFQTAFFYPFNLLYLVLPFNVSWTIIIMLQPFLAGVFMYLFLKKGIGVKDFSSLVGAISFGFSSYMTVWIEYGNIGSTLLWLPIVLLLIKYFINKKSPIYILGISFALTFAILAGYIQGVFYIYILGFFYYLFLIFSKKELKKIKRHILFIISLLLPIFLTAFQLLPTLQIFSESTRGAYSLSQIEKNLTPIFNWITIVFPDFFGNPATRNYWIDGTYIERIMYPGAVIIFFAFYAIFEKIDFLEKKFFIVVSIVSLIIATNLPLVKYFYLIPIPVISTTIPTRELSIFIFAVLVLGSMGLDVFLKEKKINIKTVLVYFGFFILSLGVVFILQKNISSLSLNFKISERNLILPTIFAITIILALYLKNKNKLLSVVILFTVLVFDLFYFFQKITPFSFPQLIYPQTSVISYLQKNAGINRFWGYGSAYIPSNFQSVDATFSPEGNDPLHISNYGALLASSQNGKSPAILPRPDANIFGGYGPEDLKSNFYRKRILDLLGVKYILNKQDLKDAFENPDLTTFPKSQYEMVFKSYPFQVYENKNFVPRIFATGDYVLAKDKPQVLSYIYNPNINLSKTIVLETLPDLKIEKKAIGSTWLISYKPNNILIKTSSAGNLLLFLSDNYYPEWEVKIDGKISKILIADYSFRAVAVPKGNHVVEFYYNPKIFKLGLKIGGFTLFLIFIASLYVIISQKRKE